MDAHDLFSNDILPLLTDDNDREFLYTAASEAYENSPNPVTSSHSPLSRVARPKKDDEVQTARATATAKSRTTAYSCAENIFLNIYSHV